MSFTPVLIADIVLACFFLFFVVEGYFKGFLVNVMRIIIALLSYFAAVKAGELFGKTVGMKFFYKSVSKAIGSKAYGSGHVLTEKLARSLCEKFGYVLVFIAAIIVINILGIVIIHLLRLIDKVPVVSLVNRIFGAMLGFLWVFILAMAIGSVVFNYVPKESLVKNGFGPKKIEQSYVIKYFVPYNYLKKE